MKRDDAQGVALLTEYLRGAAAGKTAACRAAATAEMERRTWAQRVRGLFGMLREWLAAAVEEGTIEISDPTAHHEGASAPELGADDCLWFRVGDSKFSVYPHTRDGPARKRMVELRCGASCVLLVPDDQNRWQIAPRNPAITVAALTPDSLKDLLEEMTGSDRPSLFSGLSTQHSALPMPTPTYERSLRDLDVTVREEPLADSTVGHRISLSRHSTLLLTGVEESLCNVHHMLVAALKWIAGYDGWNRDPPARFLVTAELLTGGAPLKVRRGEEEAP